MPGVRCPLAPPAETFAISTELARGVRNAILLAGYESEMADIKATETPPYRFYNAPRVLNEYGVTLHCINFYYLNVDVHPVGDALLLLHCNARRQ